MTVQHRSLATQELGANKSVQVASQNKLLA